MRNHICYYTISNYLPTYLEGVLDYRDDYGPIQVKCRHLISSIFQYFPEMLEINL